MYDKLNIEYWVLTQDSGLRTQDLRQIVTIDLHYNFEKSVKKGQPISVNDMNSTLNIQYSIEITSLAGPNHCLTS